MEKRYNEVCNIIRSDIQKIIKNKNYKELYQYYEKANERMIQSDKKKSKILLLKNKKVDENNYIYNEILEEEILVQTSWIEKAIYETINY